MGLGLVALIGFAVLVCALAIVLVIGDLGGPRDPRNTRKP